MKHMTDNAIRITDLRRDFGLVRALDGLTLDVPTGIVFGFLGPNGSGKTTTIRLLLGLLEPTSGQAEVLGRINRLDAAERAARIEALLTRLDLWDRRKDRIGGWSRGMKQKLAIARTLLHRPPLIFLDEPTAGLDAVAAVALREDLAELATQEGVTVFLTTHHLIEAEKLCARVAVIRQGRLLAVGSPDELRARSGGRHVEVRGRGLEAATTLLRARPEVQAVEIAKDHLALTLADGAEMAPLVSLMVGAGVQVDEVRRESSSLEDAFLSLVEAEA
jgi:ABC-2 type transport system ATP-binding protein